MKARVINNIPINNYPIAWLEKNKDKVINGQLVSEWELAKPYNGNLLMPIWNGNEYFESATQEEIEAYQKSLIPQTAKNMKFRLALIKVGISLNAINNAINSMPDGVKKEQIFNTRHIVWTI